MMLNSHSQSSIDALAAVAYLECYLDNTDNMPSEIQRYMTIFREIEYQCKEIITKLRCETDIYKSNADASAKKQSLSQIKKILIKEKELGDQKLEILSKIFELIENKSRSLEESARNLESIHGPPSYVKNEDKNFFSSLPSSALMTTSSSTTNTSAHQKSTNDNNFHSNNSNNNYTATLSTRASANNSNNNFKTEDKLDTIKGKRHRQAKRTSNQDSYAAVAKEEERRDEEEKCRKKKTRRDKMVDKTPLLNAANSSQLVKIIGNVDPNEPVYCLCREVSYGEMIGCDNESCEIEWYHFHCVNLTHKPKGKWFCPTCRGDRQNVLNPELLEQRKAKKNAVIAIAAAAASNSNNTSD